jgi:hypothetical protein
MLRMIYGSATQDGHANQNDYAIWVDCINGLPDEDEENVVEPATAAVEKENNS